MCVLNFVDVDVSEYMGLVAKYVNLTVIYHEQRFLKRRKLLFGCEPIICTPMLNYHSIISVLRSTH